MLACGVEVVAATWAGTNWHEAIEAAAVVARVYCSHGGALGQDLGGCDSARECHCVGCSGVANSNLHKKMIFLCLN